ncbi:YIP1 family protein [Haloarcula sp. JP-L23]|nr:YIP1 family protein [Haloarcula sp. JP-L23]
MGVHSPGMPSTVTTFVARPGAFFERRADRLSGFRGAGLAAALALLLTTVLGVALRLFSQQFTGTTTVDNPAYPGDVFCEDGVGGMTPSGCDEPATMTVEISSLLWQEIADRLPWLFVGLLFVWFGLAVALHVGAWLGSGTGRFGESMEVAAWGLVPTVVVTGVAGVALVYFATQADLAGATPETLLSEVRTLQSGVSGLTFLLIQIAGAAWQAYVWAAGLRVAHELSRRAAVVVAVVVATVPVVLS